MKRSVRENLNFLYLDPVYQEYYNFREYVLGLLADNDNIDSYNNTRLCECRDNAKCIIKIIFEILINNIMISEWKGCDCDESCIIQTVNIYASDFIKKEKKI